LQSASQAREIVAEAVVVGKDLAAPGEQLLAFLGESYEPMAPNHKPDIEILLQLPDGGRKGGLGDVAGHGSPREMPFTRQRYEVGEIPNSHALRPCTTSIVMSEKYRKAARSSIARCRNNAGHMDRHAYDTIKFLDRHVSRRQLPGPCAGVTPWVKKVRTKSPDERRGREPGTDRDAPRDRSARGPS